jgi:hypothetical protein
MQTEPARIASQPDKEEAMRSLLAAKSLGDMGPRAWDAIGALVDRFPQAVHVVEVSDYYSKSTSRGTFDDWIQTNIMGEKNKFILNPPFLGYNVTSVCRDFITAKHEIQRGYFTQGARAEGEQVALTVILTFNAGACALGRITGKPFGNDLAEWRDWWRQNQGYRPSEAEMRTMAASSPSSIIQSGTSPEDLQVGGLYRFYLATGDEMKATVEGKTDTAVIIETTEGDAYTFQYSLIQQYELLKEPVSAEVRGGAGVTEAKIMTYDELVRSNARGIKLEIRLKNKKTYTGTLESIDQQQLKLNMDGPVITFTREIVEQISTVVPEHLRKQKMEAEAEPEEPQKLDTLVVKNPELDEWGKRKDNLIFIGKVTKDDGEKVTFVTKNGEQKVFGYSEIIRRITYSTDKKIESVAQRARRYSKPLICPDGMVYVDIPMRDPGKPFFKVCIDKYEYPNQEGEMPVRNVSFAEAKELCKKQGKRLCTVEEFKWACSGLEDYTYPYGWNYDEDICNTKGAQRQEVSGNRERCVSKFGAHDMVGNVFEWVVGEDGEPKAMGGPYSKCHTVSPGGSGSPKPQTGFRCCKSN